MQPPFACLSVSMENFACVLEDGLKLSKRLVLPGDVPQPRPLMGMYAEGGTESQCRATARACAPCCRLPLEDLAGVPVDPGVGGCCHDGGVDGEVVLVGG
jgi:hypothetical protein